MEVKSIHDVIMDLNTELARYSARQDVRQVLIESPIGTDIDDVREVEKGIYDVDINAYIITLHKYTFPDEIPPKAICIGSMFYMFPTAEIVEPYNMGMHDIVEVLTSNFTHKYEIVA